MTKRLDEAVQRVKQMDWNSDYVREMMVLMDAREEGIEQGIKQGIEQVIKQGIEQGIKQGVEKERINTKAERTRADRAEALLDKYKEKYGTLT